MPFQIHALPVDPFQHYFSLSPEALAAEGAEVTIAKTNPGYPCRVSLEDAEEGERVLLINHTHLDANSPYRSAHAIYVRENASQARPTPGEVPAVLTRRILSIRGFDANHQMQDADVVDGAEIGPAIEAMFSNAQIAFIHLHNAKQGCFAAKVTRA